MHPQPAEPLAPHILILDPDPARRRVAERMLRDEGFATSAVGDAFTAIRAAGDRKFALVLAATELPGCVDAATAMRHIRARQPGIAALFIGEPAPGAAAVPEDAALFIAAPFSRRDLVGCIFALLRSADAASRMRAG